MAQTLKFGNGNFATKAGSTLCYDDQNGNFKPIPMDFTRASTATRVNKQGLIEVVKSNVPRIDYTDTSDGVLLLEKAATNSITYSEDFSQSYWTKSNATITSNSVISPEGTLNASKVTEQNVSGVHYVGASLAGGAGEYTWSCFLKQGTSRYAGMRAVVNGFQNRFFVNVDLSNGSVVDTHTVGSGTTWEYYVHKYTNGWYRLVIQAANGSGNMDMSISSSNVAQPNYSLGLPTYLGSTNNNFYIWGAQFEIGSVASSYIPTQGSAVTRVAETASGAGNSEVFNDSEGVLFLNLSVNWVESLPYSLTLGISITKVETLIIYSFIFLFVVAITNKKARIKYITTKAAPPFSAALVGKPQILPRPTAEPDAAKINAKREEN